ncbi:MAG: UDP-4-amino-4,6-dideoxy-N-acetyl-beta-L-altrosamine transaminase [Bacteroidetes bacterium]|nr:UDP-4-amino-4,6-dideoxy-N-acetyl-beta-L-altrosamine transaminase [Bacteroidota bacterium]
MYKIPYGKQEITNEDISEVIKTLQSDFLTQGPKILEFENRFAEYVDAKYAVAVCNGTAALHMAVLALGLQPGQKIITTPITFVASANCALYAGAEVAFVDIDAEDYNIDVDKLEALLKGHPKNTFAGIVPVAFAGCPVRLEKISALAKEHGLWIVEDACHAPGGYFKDSKGKQIKCGSTIYSDLSCFSFHPVKHIAAGEGGMITTSNLELYNKLKLLRTHGITKEASLLKENHGGWYYEMQELGYNYRISDINAALALSQLNRADKGITRRQEIAKKYRAAFADLPISYQKEQNDYFNAYHLYVIETDRRKELYDFLITQGIYSQIHYIPVHMQPYYKGLGFKKGDFPVAERYYERCISLPMYASISDAELDHVISSVKNFFNVN